MIVDRSEPVIQVGRLTAMTVVEAAGRCGGPPAAGGPALRLMPCAYNCARTGNRKTPKRDVLTLFSVTRVPKSDIALKGLSTSFLHTRNALRLVLAKCSAVFFKIIKRNAEYNV